MLPNEDLYRRYKAQTECFGDGWDGSPSGDEVCQGCTANTQCFEHFSLVTLPRVIKTMEAKGETPNPSAVQNHFSSQPDPMDFDLSMESVEKAIDNFKMHNPPKPQLVEKPALEPMVTIEEEEEEEEDSLPSFGEDEDSLPSFSMSDDGAMSTVEDEPTIKEAPSTPSPPSLGAMPAMPAFEPQKAKVTTAVIEPPKIEDTGGPSVNFPKAGSVKIATESASNQEQTKSAQHATQQVLREAVNQKRKRGRPAGSKKPLNQLKNKRYQRDRQRFENNWEAWGPQTYLSRWQQERERWPTLARLPVGTVIRRQHNENSFKVTLKQGYWEFSHPSVEASLNQNRWPTLSSITRAITGFYLGPKWFRIEESLNQPVKEAILRRLRDKDL